jgi:hypothetical protein
MLIAPKKVSDFGPVFLKYPFFDNPGLTFSCFFWRSGLVPVHNLFPAIRSGSEDFSGGPG